MYRLIALVLLAGCMAQSSAPGFRKPGTQIYSNAVLENEKLVGNWVQVAEFAPQPHQPAPWAGPGFRVPQPGFHWLRSFALAER